MLNTFMKNIPKAAGGDVSKFWELFIQESNAGKLSVQSLIPQPYKEMKELAEESKNPISALPKITIAQKKPATKTLKYAGWDTSILASAVEDAYKNKFIKAMLQDYVEELVM